MTFESLFTCYKPIEDYYYLLKTTLVEEIKPIQVISALDAFLMYHIATFFPTTPTVIDLLAEDTLGASVAFWTATPEAGICNVFVPLPDQTKDESSWYSVLTDALAQLNLNVQRVKSLDTTTDRLVSLGDATSKLSPHIVVWSPKGQDPNNIAESMQRLLSLHPSTTLLLLPLGFTGESPAIEAALSFCHRGDSYRLSLLREYSMFTSSSQLGIIFHRESTQIPAIIERMRQMFDGNFDFLELLKANMQLHIEKQQLEADLSIKQQELEVVKGYLAHIRQRSEADNQAQTNKVTWFISKLRRASRLTSKD